MGADLLAAASQDARDGMGSQTQSKHLRLTRLRKRRRLHSRTAPERGCVADPPQRPQFADALEWSGCRPVCQRAAAGAPHTAALPSSPPLRAGGTQEISRWWSAAEPPEKPSPRALRPGGAREPRNPPMRVAMAMGHHWQPSARAPAGRQSDGGSVGESEWSRGGSTPLAPRRGAAFGGGGWSGGSAVLHHRLISCVPPARRSRGAAGECTPRSLRSEKPASPIAAPSNVRHRIATGGKRGWQRGRSSGLGNFTGIQRANFRSPVLYAPAVPAESEATCAAANCRASANSCSTIFCSFAHWTKPGAIFTKEEKTRCASS